MWAVGGLVWEKLHPIFTRGGVAGHGVRNAAQLARVPFSHIVEKVARVFSATRFKYFLLLAYGEPVGAPVCVIFKLERPCIGLLVVVIIDEV